MCYPDSVEEIYVGLTISKHKPLPLSTFYDSDLAHDRITRRSIDDVVGMVEKIAINHKPKRQTSIETSTYSAELSVGRVSIEHFQEMRCMLRSLCAEVIMSTKDYGDNKSSYESCANKKSECKSRHSSASFHKMRESVASVMITPCHVCLE